METTITHKLDHFISVEKAKALIKVANNTTYGTLVNKSELMEILDQDDCNGVNIYVNTTPVETNTVVVGVNTKGDELSTKIIGWCPPMPPFTFGCGGNIYSLT